MNLWSTKRNRWFLLVLGVLGQKPWLSEPPQIGFLQCRMAVRDKATDRERRSNQCDQW